MIDVTNIWDSICNWCITVMWQMTSNYNVSYGFINVWLFCIIEPLAILLFMLSAIFFARKSKRSAIVLFVAGIVCIVSILIPIIHTVITMETC